MASADDQREWKQITPNIWVLTDSAGTILRQVAKAGPYLGQQAATFIVTGGDQATSHSSRQEAFTAAEASAFEPGSTT